MTEDATPGGTDPDPEDLRRQLEDIKGAMGLADRYPGQRRLWLVYGVGVGLAIILLQGLFFWTPEFLPGWVYQLFVLGFALLTTAGLFRLAANTPPREATEHGPDWRVFFLTLVFVLFALGLFLEPILEVAIHDLPRASGAKLEGGAAYGLVIAVAGIGFLFAGNALRAYRIRRLDRWVFYGAGAWMVGYAVLFTQVRFLGGIGYGLFGLLLISYSIGAYVVLGRGGEADG